MAEFTDPAAEAKKADAEKKKQEAAAVKRAQDELKRQQEIDAEKKKQEAAAVDAENRVELERRQTESDKQIRQYREREQADADWRAKAASDTVTLSKAQHEGILARLAAAEARLSSIQAPPPPAQPSGPDGSHDLDKYTDGELTSRADGKTKYRMRFVPTDEHGKRYHLKNKTHFFQAANVAELRDHFDGELLSRLEKRELAMAQKAAKTAGAHIEDEDEDDD